MRWLAPLLLVFPLAADAKKPTAPVPPAWAAGTSVSDAYNAAAGALNARKYEDAATGFTMVLAGEPDCGLALLGLGRALVLQGKHADALVPLSRAGELFPDRHDPQIWRGKAFIALHQPVDALAAAKAALVIKPANIEAVAVAQAALLEQKDYAQAHAMIAEVLAQSNQVAFFCLDGLVYVAEGDLARAAEMLPKCEGVPDAALYASLREKVTAAPR